MARPERTTRRWATSSVWRAFVTGTPMDVIACTAYAAVGRPHPPAWLATPAGQAARVDVEAIVRRRLRRVGRAG